MPIELYCGSFPVLNVDSYAEVHMQYSGQTEYGLTFTIIAGNLPYGMNINEADGTIYGTPEMAYTYTFTVNVRDNGDGSQAQATCSLVTRYPSQPIQIFCGTPPAGVVGQQYYHKFPITGGSSPYVVFTTLGTLPSGLSVNNQGEVTGIPDVQGNWFFKINVSDAYAQTSNTSCSIYITQPTQAPSLSCNNPPAGQVGTYYFHAVRGTGGVEPYRFQIQSGAMPPGISLAYETGAVTGFPTTEGVYTFTVLGTDAIGQTATITCSITVQTTAPPVTLGCNNPPGGIVGVPYNHTFLVMYGVPPFNVYVNTGTFVPGLAINPVTAAVIGTPLWKGTWTFNLAVRDAMNQYAYANCTISVQDAAAALSITCNNPPAGTVGTVYHHVLIAAGGHPPYTYAIVAGALPPGMHIDANANIDGTPSNAGRFDFTVRVTDSNNVVNQTNCSITIVAASSLNVSCNNIPQGMVGNVYNHTLTASGGTGPYTWSLITGNFPTGLTLNADGTITGTPTTYGGFDFSAKAVDSLASEATVSCTLIILQHAEILGISCNNLPIAVAGAAYDHSVAAGGGTSPYTYAITDGTLPAGLAMASSGRITGAALTPGISVFEVTVTDSASPTPGTAVVTCSILVNATSNLTVACGDPPDGQTGAPYSYKFTASQGVQPYVYSISGGALPNGLTLQSNGYAVGTPTQVGNYTFEVTVRDYNNSVDKITCAISVFAAPVIDCNSPPPGKVSVQYVHQVAVPVGYAIRISEGALPGGLTMTEEGLITGIPTTAGTYTFTIGPIT